MINMKSIKETFATQFTHKSYRIMQIIVGTALVLAIVLNFFRATQNFAIGLISFSYFMCVDLLTFRLCKTNLNLILCLILGTLLPILLFSSILIVLAFTAGY
ncbi:hypothetical protein IWT5_00529 [Secundilactobacillus silagincola]|uniref:Uncharacterized protein n=1 Tax=Secundilactobacillus silagincola TaxID=1714681 RepID=A0A1Z5H4L4_9LACO|nr:hypothetical protein IWT5_00529 [Secundilactobacillus silagincola]